MKESKKDLILKASVKIFAEKGYQSSTILEIANQAGVSKGLVHFYFENKLDLLLSAIILFMRTVNDKNRKKFSTKTGPIEKLNAVFETFQELLLNDRGGLYWEHILKEGVPYSKGNDLKKLKGKIEEIEKENSFLKNSLDDIILEGQRTGDIVDDFKPAVIRQILGGSSQLLFYGLYLKSFKNADIGYDKEDINVSLKKLIDKFRGTKEIIH